jgi:hypothetical protein
MGQLEQQPGTTALEEMDTVALKFRVGGVVKCIMGELRGLEGVVAGTRSEGRLLVRVATGVYIEVPRICLRNV